MSNFQVSKWIRFFKEAGIPSDPATSYAIIFYDNRIQDDMLPDLTKEILRDMGIYVMGDVIAILRHAKQVHAQAEREKAAQAFVTAKDDVLETEKSRPTVASRMVDQWMSNQKSSPGSQSPSRGGDSPSRTSASPKKKLTIQTTVHNDEPPAKIAARSLSERFAGPHVAMTMNRKASVPSDAKRLSITSKSGPVKMKKIINNPKKAAPSAIVAKAKRVESQSVFDRLGKEPEATPEISAVKMGIKSSSSTSSKKEMKSLKPLKTSVMAQQKEQSPTSVFSRLGGLSKPATSVKTSVQPVTPSLRPKLSIKLGSEGFEDVDYTSHSVLQPAKRKRSLVAKATKGTKPVKQVKPVKRSVGLVADTDDSKSVFTRLGGKV